MRRQRLAEGCDGGGDDLLGLAAQPTVDGADLSRLSHSLLQPAAGTNVEIEVELVDLWWRPASGGENFAYVLRIGEGEHSRGVRDRCRPWRQVVRDRVHRHLHPRVLGQRPPAYERHSRA